MRKVFVFQGFLNIPVHDRYRSQIKQIHVVKNELNSNVRHIGVPSKGIPNSTVDNATESLAYQRRKPACRTEYEVIFAGIGNDEANIISAYNFEYFIEPVSQLFACDPLHSFSWMQMIIHI